PAWVHYLQTQFGAPGRRQLSPVRGFGNHTSARRTFRLLMAAPTIQTPAPVSDESVPTRPAPARIRNRILSLLPGTELEALLERCEMVTIKSKDVVFRRDEEIRHIYFPEDCVISLVTELEDGDSVEAMRSEERRVGKEGSAG